MLRTTDALVVEGGSSRAAMRPTPECREGRSWLQKRLLHAILRVADFLDRYTAVCLVCISLTFVPLCLVEAHDKLLSNDEIYTVHIAQAPTIPGMLSMERQIDLHPPMHYLTERASLRLPLPRWLGARLPNMLAGLILCFALFRFTQARLGNLYGMVAVSTLWFSADLDYAWSNRPYMQWLMWLALLLLARDRAISRNRPIWATLAVFATASAMVLTDLLGVACLLPFWIAEVLRARERCRMDWPLAVALTAPIMFGVGCHYQIHHVAENIFPADRLPSFGLAINTYGDAVGSAALILPGCLAIMLLLFGKERLSVSLRSRIEETFLVRGFGRQDTVLLVALLLLPLLLFIPSNMFRVQFWERYGSPAAIASAILLALIIARRMPLARVFAVATLAASLGFLTDRMLNDPDQLAVARQMSGGRMPIPLKSLDQEIPIVAASPMAFIEMSDREPADIVHRVFYLTDRDAEIKYAQYTLFDNEDKIRRILQLPSHVEALKPFLEEHETFYVVGSYQWKEIWLLRVLAADGMKLNYLGKFESTYESDDLYLVSRSVP